MQPDGQKLNKLQDFSCRKMKIAFRVLVLGHFAQPWGTPSQAKGHFGGTCADNKGPWNSSSVLFLPSEADLKRASKEIRAVGENEGGKLKWSPCYSFTHWANNLENDIYFTDAFQAKVMNPDVAQLDALISFGKIEEKSEWNLGKIDACFGCVCFSRLPCKAKLGLLSFPNPTFWVLH